MTNLHTLDTARAYCERIIGMAAGKVVFDGKPDELTTEAVRAIYGSGADGAEISESMTSTEPARPAVARPMSRRESQCVRRSGRWKRSEPDPGRFWSAPASERSPPSGFAYPTLNPCTETRL
jgi:ABC-type multidrug transport system ATPase subunit